MIRFFLALCLVCGAIPLEAAAQRPAATPLVATADAPSTTAEQLAAETEARREADHRVAIAEAKADVIEAGNSRLEVLVGAFGLLITVLLGLAAFFTWRSAAASAASAARDEVRGLRETLQRIGNEASQIKITMDELADDATVKHARILKFSDELEHIAAASPGRADTAPNESEIKSQLADATKEISKIPKTQWSATQYRIMLLGAEGDQHWRKYVRIANEMADNYADSPGDISHALFAIAYGYGKIDEHQKAAEAYEKYIDQCPDDDSASHAAAFCNWASELTSLALSKEDGNSDEVKTIWMMAKENFSKAFEISPHDYEILNMWGSSLDDNARSRAPYDRREADYLWTLAAEKFAAALSLKPGDAETLSNWGAALLSQALIKKTRAKAALLKIAEEKLVAAEAASKGSGSYNLACLAALRGQAAKAAKWLRAAKVDDLDFDCADVRTEKDFDAVRDTPEFQQAMVDIGCAPASEQEPTP